MGTSPSSRHLGAGVPTRARSGYDIQLGTGVANGKICHRISRLRTWSTHRTILTHRKILTSASYCGFSPLSTAMEEFIHSLIDWMKANEQLAGWAQFGGATLALIVAIWVPWYQARMAEKALKAERIEREIANIQGVFFLLTDIEIWLKSVGGRGAIPRKMFNQGFQASDLLERIRLWESREERDDRINAMFLARGALIRAQEALCLDFLADQPVTDSERGFLQKGIDEIRKNILEIEQHRHEAYRARNLNKTVWFAKPIAILIWSFFPNKD